MHGGKFFPVFLSRLKSDWGRGGINDNDNNKNRIQQKHNPTKTTND